MNWDATLFSNDAYRERFRRLRDEDPVHLHRGHPQFGSFWSLTRYDDILAADLDSQRFVAGDSFVLAEGSKDFPLPMFLAMNDPQHDRYRDAVKPFFANSHIDTLEQAVRDSVVEILDDLPEDGPFDWVARVSIELTSRMLALLLGFPAEARHDLIRWSDLAVLDPTLGPDQLVDWNDRQKAFMECFAALQPLRKRAAQGTPDLIRMLDGAEGGTQLRPSEFLGNILMLIVAGNDTTRNSISGAILALDRYPEQLAKLRADPAAMGSAVREVFRWQTPITYMRRMAAVDMQLHGKHIHAGDKVVLWYASGNADERVFEAPEKFDIERGSGRRSLAFGFGIHRCLGVRLAELQLRVVLEELLARFSHIEVVADPVLAPSMFVRGYAQMMVQLRR